MDAFDKVTQNILQIVAERNKAEERCAELSVALRWALDQIEDDLDPDHQAALAHARALIS